MGQHVFVGGCELEDRRLRVGFSTRLHLPHSISVKPGQIHFILRLHRLEREADHLPLSVAEYTVD